MKFPTLRQIDRFRELGSQESKGDDAIVVAKLFTPDSGWTWWASEYSEADQMFFGLVQGHEVELGYFSLQELRSIRGPLRLPVERDLYWRETTLARIREGLVARRS